MIYNWIGGLLAAATTVSGTVYFKENFNSQDWQKKWAIPSNWKAESDLGAWKWTPGQWYADASDHGIQTSENHRFYGLSAKLDQPFTNKDKELVVQFSVKYEQENPDCGGAYIKLLGDMDQDSFGGDTPYQVMFGPDMCGSSNRKTHVIFHYEPKNDNLLINDKVKMEADKYTHLYTLVVRPDNTFEVLIDLKSVRQGTLEDSFNFLQPREIKDPTQSKPADWVDVKRIPDPEDHKPEGYDDIPAEIPDPQAEKPDDWDEEEDGAWEPPMIDNPDYKGPWKPKTIPNPEYKGEWIHPLIPNPDYVEDASLYVRCKDCKHIGFELWQVTAGTLFDDIIVTDSFEEAKAYAESTWGAKIGGEKEMYDAILKEKKAAEADSGDEEEHDEL